MGRADRPAMDATRLCVTVGVRRVNMASFTQVFNGNEGVPEKSGFIEGEDQVARSICIAGRIQAFAAVQVMESIRFAVLQSCTNTDLVSVGLVRIPVEETLLL